MLDDRVSSTTDARRSSTTGTPDPAAQPEPTGPDALAAAVRRLAEAREYVSYLIAVEFDRFKLRLRRAAIWAIIGLAGVAVLLAVLTSAAFLVLWGLAMLIGEALGGRIWLGALIIGLGFLAIGGGILAAGLYRWNAGAYSAVRKKYAQRRQRQRDQFGRTVDRDPF